MTTHKCANSRLIRLFFLFLGALCQTVPAYAQSALEEIVVTAQKREQNSQDVGIAMTVFDGRSMERLGVQSSHDIAGFTPGVHISASLGGQNTQFTIRGVTQSDFSDTNEAPNAVYIDEGYVAIAQGQSFATFDIERTEILRGPQGTLFGRNATGGLVRYITRKPTFDGLDGYMNVEYGNYESSADASSYNFEGAVGGPFSDRIAGRLAVRYYQRDPYLDNIYPFQAVGAPPGPDAGADTGDDETLSFRGSLVFNLSDSVSLDLAVSRSESEMSSAPYQSLPSIGIYDAQGELINAAYLEEGSTETRAGIAFDGSDAGADTSGDGTIDFFGRPAGANLFGYIDPDGDGFRTSSNFAFEDQNYFDTTDLYADLRWTINDNLEFVAISDYKQFEKLLFTDGLSHPANTLAAYFDLDADSFTQELRLDGQSGRIFWVAGLYYLSIDTATKAGFKVPLNNIGGSPPFDIGTDAEIETDSTSLFGQVEFELTDELTLIAGARAIREKKNINLAQNFYPTVSSREVHQGVPFLNPLNYMDEKSETMWSGKLQLDWAPSDGLLFYGGLNRGVKAGSYNAPIFGGLPVPTSAYSYDKEVLTSFEVGFKSTIHDGKTRINGSAFYYDYEDYQALLFTGVSGVIVNADAENKGLELEIQTAPIDGLLITGGVSWFDATVKDVPLRVGSPLPPRDVNPTYAPEFQVMGMARYEWPALRGLVSVQADASYSDEYYHGLRNFDADILESYTMVGARLGWADLDGHWEATLSARNLTDERAGILGFDLATLCGCNQVNYRAPLWYGITLKYNINP